MSTYSVGVSAYPKEIVVEADSPEMARDLAKAKCDFSVWAIEYCDEVEE